MTRALIHALAMAMTLSAQAPPASTSEAPKPAVPKPQQPLSFFSQRFKYVWDQLIPLKVNVDGLKLNAIYFNRREVASGLFKGAEFGTRARVEVTNTGTKSRAVGFAVAVFDANDRLLGVASAGTKLFALKPGATENYDLSFEQVLERLPLGTTFVLSMEISE